ncbi:MAG TPA: enoyl-CoA hydratase-related protein [Chloroflexota bacterium]
MGEHVRTVIEGQIGIVTIDNPPVNAIAWPIRVEIREALEALAADDGIRVVILTGAGEKIFVAGADITEFPPLRYASGIERQQRNREWWDYVAHYVKPLLAALNGHTLGGGLELAMCCDVRIAASHARLGLPETGLGIIPAGGGTQRLARLVGAGRAKLMIFSAEPLSAEGAERCGLVEKVVPGDRLLDECRSLAAKIVSRGPLAVQLAKEAINAGFERPLAEGLDYESECFARLMDTEDKNEGVAAFLEKRTPSWRGR